MAEDAKATFDIELQDNVSAGAQSAASALSKLQGQLEGDTKALADMQKAMRQLKGATTADVKQPMEELTKRIVEQKDRIAEAQGRFVALGGTFGKAGKSASSFSARIAELQRTSASMPGNLNGIVQKLTSVTEGMKGATAGAIGLAVAFAAVAAGSAVVAKHLFSEALAAGDARRNEMLHLEALTKMRNIFGILPGKADDIMNAIDRVSASVSISREKVTGYAEQLFRAGVRGNTLADALEGTAIKASALGDSAGSGFAGFAADLAIAGGSVKNLTNDIKNRFGGIVQRQMSSLEVQQRKQKENWASLFRGLNVEPVLDAMKRLRDILNINTASGQALKSLFTSMLKPMFAAAETGIVFMRRFFKQMIIGALQLKLAWQDVRYWFAKTFGKSQTQSAGDLLDKIQLGKWTVYLLAAAFSYLAIMVGSTVIGAFTSFVMFLTTAVIVALWEGVVAAASFAIAILGVTWPFLLAAVALAAFAVGLMYLYDLWNEIDWTALGTGLWESIVKGLRSGWAKVKSVFADLADEAANAFRSALGIATPAKVFAELIYQLPSDVKTQVAGSPRTQSSNAARVGGAPKLGGQTQKGPPADGLIGGKTASNTKTSTVTIGSLNVHAPSAEPHALARTFRRELERTLEGLHAESGAPQRQGAAAP